MHPSREAELRCRSCRKWLCDRCVRVFAGHIHCSRKCQVLWLLRSALAVAWRLGRWRVAPAVAIALAAGGAAVLLSAVGLLVADLVELAGDGERPYEAPPPRISGSLREGEHGWSVRVDGPPGSALLIVSGGQPVTVLLLDADGAGSVTGLDLGAEPRVDLVPLGTVAATLRPAAGLQGTPLATLTARAGPSRTASPEPRPSPTPTPPARPSPSPKPSASPPVRPTLAVSAGARNVRRGAPPVLHLVTDVGPRIAITFDGGSSSNGTAELLDLLVELDLKVTMFVTGRFIEKQPGLIRRALLEGHEIGNHTYSHPRLTSYATDRTHRTLPHVNRDWFEAELLRTEQAFFAATGEGMAPLWRSPYGEENALLRGWAAELGYLHVRWSSLSGASLDSWDWVEDEHNQLYQHPRQMVRRLLSFPKLEGGIVLMHLASDRHEPPWEALPVFLDALRRREIEPVRVSDLIEHSSIWRGWLERCRANHRRTLNHRLRLDVTRDARPPRGTSASPGHRGIPVGPEAGREAVPPEAAQENRPPPGTCQVRHSRARGHQPLRVTFKGPR